MDELCAAYKVLNLKPGASPDEVKRAFREQVVSCHPDRFAGDRSLQQRAEERLRLVIEAHRLIVAGQAGARGMGFGGFRTQEGWAALRAFFGSPPNLVFALFCIACALFAAGRFGVTFRALLYQLEIGLIPAIFAVAFNLSPRAGTLVRNLYVGFSLAAILVVAVDGVVKDGGTTGWGQGHEVSESFDSGSTPYHGGGPAGWPGPAVEEPAGGGAAAPRAPSAPLAPLAPVAPVAPAAPLAPAAPAFTPVR